MNLSKNLVFKSLFRQSYYSNIDLTSSFPSFNANDLKITRTTKYLTKPPQDPKIMQFGAFHSDHLLEINWTENRGWTQPEIVPFKNFEIHPYSSCLHYAIECFEGCKAYKNANGQIRLFRLDSNMYRFKQTAKRLALPDFDGEQLLKCISALLKVDRDWIPDQPGFSCYIRPTMIATEETLGVRASSKAKLFVCLCPVGPYFPTGLKPVKVYCNTETIRSAPGGVGGYKVAGNYAPTVQPLKDVQKMGFAQSLWCLRDGLVQEMGVCNLFFFWKNKDGQDELVTPELDGTILPGIVRDSVLDITREKRTFKVTERKIYITEVIEALKEGRMKEMFGTGTAVNIQPIESIGYEEQMYSVKIDPKLNAGPLSHELFEKLHDIQFGTGHHKWIQEVV